MIWIRQLVIIAEMAFVDHPGKNYGSQPHIGKEGSSYSQAPHPITDSMPRFRGEQRHVRHLPSAGPWEMARSALLDDLTESDPPSPEAVEEVVAEFQWREHARSEGE